MKVYVASSIESYKSVEALQQQLRALGCTIHHDWAELYHRQKEHGPPRPDDLSRQQMKAAAEADLLILLTPGGRGAHVEYGVALGSPTTKTIVILAPWVKSIGFYAEADYLVHSVVAAVALVQEMNTELAA